jgi:hypothetical protein
MADTLIVSGQRTKKLGRYLIVSGSLSLTEVSERMKLGLSLKEKRYRFKKHHRCFLGSEAVTWMVHEGIVQNRDAAFVLGNRLLQANYFQHVTRTQRFSDSSALFKFQCVGRGMVPAAFLKRF